LLRIDAIVIVGIIILLKIDGLEICG